MEHSILMLLGRFLAFLMAFMLGALILIIIKRKYPSIKINPPSIVGVIFILGGFFNIYIGIEEPRYTSLVLGPILLLGSYFFIKRGQNIE